MNRLGFSLTEVIIAALILVLSVGALLSVFTTEKAGVIYTGRKIEAMDFARQTIEELKNAVDAGTWDGTGDLTPGTHNAEAFLSLAGTEFGDTLGATRSYDVVDGPAADSYRKVTVIVDWNEP
jgi:type II secretory pathway pseudopilin PulG